MAKRKKKHQKERVLEPLVEPGRPIEVPDKIPAITPSRVASFINTGNPVSEKTSYRQLVNRGNPPL